jgi:predicted DNA-binding antitoxin AbrB/MazE fold protein
MATLRLRYQEGQLIPLEPLPDLRDGDEIEVEWSLVPSDEEIDAMLDQTRGMWADLEDIEPFIEEARARWDQEWQDRLASL